MSIGFTGARIERADQIRVDADQVRAAMGSLSARLLLMDGLDPVSDGGDGLAWGMLSDVPPDTEGEILIRGPGVGCWAGGVGRLFAKEE